jgi:NADPH:quinone reductase-like Zn-dependent oxidoreductase
MNTSRDENNPTMSAVVQHTYGPSDLLALEQIRAPVPGDDGVLLRVHAAGVNPADWAITNGTPYVVRVSSGLFRPRNRVGGSDVAGIVEVVGSAVTRFRPGDAVFGVGKGAYAESAVAREKYLVSKPAHITFEQAAAAPMAGLTALQAMRGRARVRAGQTVLINGAGGGVGTFAVQIARALGAVVTGVCSPSKAELVRSIGADHVIDYTREDFTRTGERYDVILDNVGNRSLSECRRALTPTGTLVPNAGQFENRWTASLGRVMRSLLLSKFVSHELRPFVSTARTGDLIELQQMMESGTVTPVVSRTFPLAETAAALDLVGAGHAAGKTVITVGGTS